MMTATPSYRGPHPKTLPLNEIQGYNPNSLASYPCSPEGHVSNCKLLGYIPLSKVTAHKGFTEATLGVT